MTPTFPLSPYRPPLAPPALLEAERVRLARELENYLEPLLTYCDQREADEKLSEAEFRHVFALRQAVAALGRYDANAEALLGYYRQGLSAARQQATRYLPSLEEALGLPPIPAPEGDRARAPLYRLGWYRGYRKAQRHYEQLTSLYAQYTTLVVPAGHQPSPLARQVSSHLESAAVQQLAGLPAELRQAISHLPLTASDAESAQAAA